MTRRLLAVAVVVALLPQHAVAQSSSAQAEELFRQARSLMTAKKYSEACSTFESSLKLDATATTMFSLAVCRELEGKLATAWGLFVDFERQNRSSSDATVQELLKNSAARAAKLQPRLSKLTIAVPAASRAADLEVQRSGSVVDSGAWDRSLPVDGGTYVITARRPNHEDWSSSITIKGEGDAQTVTVPALAQVSVAIEKPVAPRAKRSLVVPFVLAGGAVILGGGALGFELWGRGLHRDGQDAYDALDFARGDDLQAKANKRRYIAQGLGIAALGTAAIAVVLFVRGGSEAAPAATSARFQVTPVASGEQVGLSVDGRW